MLEIVDEIVVLFVLLRYILVRVLFKVLDELNESKNVDFLEGSLLVFEFFCFFLKLFEL